jgi:hypothetical protein
MIPLEARKQSILERLAITHPVTVTYIENNYGAIITGRLRKGVIDESIIATISTFLELPNAAIQAARFGEALRKTKNQGLI